MKVLVDVKSPVVVHSLDSAEPNDAATDGFVVWLLGLHGRAHEHKRSPVFPFWGHKDDSLGKGLLSKMEWPIQSCHGSAHSPLIRQTWRFGWSVALMA